MGMVDEIKDRTLRLSKLEMEQRPKSVIRQLSFDIEYLINLICNQGFALQAIDNEIISLFIALENSQDPATDLSHALSQAKKIRLKIAKQIRAFR